MGLGTEKHRPQNSASLAKQADQFSPADSHKKALAAIRRW